MKTYFAKYLQVAGSIEDDDFFLTPDGRISQCKQVLESLPATIMNYSGETWKENELKKVQLFLCSRDIQVGEVLYNLDTNEYQTVNNEFSLKDERDSSPLYIKVISPISPQAVWVKEGDAFEEEDIRREGFYRGSLSSWSQWISEMDGWIESPIKIKCPTCKTFH